MRQPSVSSTRNSLSPVSVQSTSGTPGTLIAAASAGFLDLISLVLTNETATATIVSISDGTITYKFALAASGGGVFNFGSDPIPATTAATAWTISNSASSTIDAIALFLNS